MERNAIDRYRDILYLPHPVSRTHSRMSRADRAVQFAPFAALTGLDAMIQESGRQTEAFVTLDEDAAAQVNACLQRLLAMSDQRPMVRLTFYVPDEKKPGGAYVTRYGQVRRIDPSLHQLYLTDQTQIPIPRIRAIEFCKTLSS